MKILITAGGTVEKIDDVRAISNNSTGRLGVAIANAFQNSDNLPIEQIFYVCGQNAVSPIPDNSPLSDKINIIRIGGVNELVAQIESILSTQKIDVVIHSMAVSDYSVSSLTTKRNVSNTISASLIQEDLMKHSPYELAEKITNNTFDVTCSINADNKISSDIDDLIIVMKKTPKVISIIKPLQAETILVGFKLLSNVSLDTLIDVGYGLLQKNSCDLVLANDMTQITNDKHVGYLISPDKTFERLETKTQIAEAIVAHVTGIINAKKHKSRCIQLNEGRI